jgi:hypothetical protein
MIKVRLVVTDLPNLFKGSINLDLNHPSTIIGYLLYSRNISPIVLNIADTGFISYYLYTDNG